VTQEPRQARPRGVTPNCQVAFLLRMATLVCTQPELFSMKAQERLIQSTVSPLSRAIRLVARTGLASLTSQKPSLVQLYS